MNIFMYTYIILYPLLYITHTYNEYSNLFTPVQVSVEVDGSIKHGRLRHCPGYTAVDFR